MHKTYTLNTLADVFNQVPPDKIETCLRELAVVMVKVHSLHEALKGFAESLGVEVPDTKPEWKPDAEWVDDGLGNVSVTVPFEGGRNLTLTTKVTV